MFYDNKKEDKNFQQLGSIACARDPKLIQTGVCQFFHKSAL